MSRVRQSSTKKQIRINNAPAKWGGYSRNSEYFQRQGLEDGELVSVGKQASLSYGKTLLSQSLLREQDYNLITREKKSSTHTYSKKHNPKQHKVTPSKDFQTSNSRSLINSQDSRFAIQSQPNQLTIDRSLYFNDQETDYRSIMKDKQTDKEMSALKLMRLLCKFDPVMYIKKFTFIKIKYKLTEHKRFHTNQEQIQQHQLGLINKLFGKTNEHNSNNKLNETKIKKVKIPYYNKLVGLCNPLLIRKQQLMNTDNNNNNVSQIPSRKESTCMDHSERSFVFNFQITPKPPVNNKKRIVKKGSYSGTSKSWSRVS